MFNNINNAGSQSHQEVDDIFAETDEPKNSPTGMNGIETRRVGLSSNAIRSEEPMEKSGGGKVLKIVLILVVVSIVGLGGYLAYSKFLNKAADTTETAGKSASSSQPAVQTPAVNNTVQSETGSVVTPASEKDNTAENLASSSVDNLESETPLIPGVNAPAEVIATATLPIVSNVDSDLDGLIDTDEVAAGSNPNVIDSDNDGLSDYEEIRVYKTNPINPDTDGDTYLDGAEVRSGYNPNGSGKMPGTVVK